MKELFTRKAICFLGFSCLLIFLLASCQQWDKWDESSGNQIYPTLEKVASYTFESGVDSAFELSAYTDGAVPTTTTDNDLGSNVLLLNGGYARLDNPLNSVTVQNGVSLTFWMKQVTQSDGQDLTGALFSFQNETGTQKLYFTANGELNYEGSNDSYDDNNSSDTITGVLSEGEWHYVAITVRTDGYALYVDGDTIIDKDVSDFDFSEIVSFMNTAPNLYIGYGSDSETQEWMMDDLNIYRNQISSTQIAKPDKGGTTTDYIIVGNEDYTTSWWSAFSDFVPMTGNHTTHYGFYNYTSGTANWYNWILVVTNGKDRDETGYAEYFVLRADAYGWGDSNYDGANITSDFDFTDGSFLEDMKGAYVDLSITRTDNTIAVAAVITATSGTVYHYTFSYTGTLATTIGTFLTCEGSYLAIDPNEVHVGETYSANSYLVGPSDLTAGWWSYFSDYSTISGDTSTPFIYTFYNYTSESNNWNNWLLVVTNGKERTDSDYAEYFVLRADAYGWGDSNYSGDNISASYDWSTFASQMNGAFCKISLTRSGTGVTMTAKVTTADGEELGDYTFSYDGISTTNIGAFLTVEAAYLDIRSVGYYPFLDE